MIRPSLRLLGAEDGILKVVASDVMLDVVHNLGL